MNKLTGKIVQITFYDHAIKRKQDGTALPDYMICTAWGKVIKDTKKSFKICHWDVKTNDFEMKHFNQEKSVILKADIIEIKELFSI